MPVARSHEEIYDLVMQTAQLAEQANKLASDAVSRSDLAHLVGQRVEDKVDKLIKTIGAEGEDERGVHIGTGIIGRLMRLEHEVSRRFGFYDGWMKTLAGFGAAIALAWGIVWWLVGTKLSTLFRGA